MNIGIYKIQHIKTGRLYIGASLNIPNRLATHAKRLRAGRHANPPLQNAYNKYGQDAFLFIQILSCAPENLDFYEDLIIKGYKANRKPFGYNCREVSHTNRGMILDRGFHIPGKKYGRLTLISRHDNFSHGKKWLCKCDCGKEITANVYAVKRGGIASCGCLMSDARQARVSYKSGDRFNRLTLVSREQKKYVGKILKHYWKVKCECGVEKIVEIGPIVSGATISCGCALSDFARNLNYKHGFAKTKTHNAWLAMRARAKKTGAKICNTWQKDFISFLKDMGESLPDQELLRKDRNKPFCPKNCFWGSNSDLARNTKRNKYVFISGKKTLLKDAENILGIHRSSINQRARDFRQTYQQAADHFARKKGLLP